MICSVVREGGVKFVDKCRGEGDGDNVVGDNENAEGCPSGFLAFQFFDYYFLYFLAFH